MDSEDGCSNQPIGLAAALRHLAGERHRRDSKIRGLLRTIRRTMRGTIDRRRLGILRTTRWIFWLTALSLAVPLGMLVLGGFILFDLRTDAWNRSEQASDNLILALSRDIARSLHVYDLSLQGSIDALRLPALAQADPAIRQMALFDISSTAEYLGALLVVDTKGDVIVESTSLVPHPLNMNFREHFLVHQGRADVGLFVSRSFQARLENAPVIALTRRFNNPDGSFGGIVEGTVRTAYFRDLFDELDIGPHGSVTLFRSDGRVIMRRPFRAADIDQDLSNAATFRAFLGAPHGHLVGTAGLDKVQRLYTFHQIDNLPLILSVAVAVDDIYSDWWRKATSIGAILTALCVSSVILCLLFRREILRRTVAETSLKEAAERLSVMALTDGLTGIANRRCLDDTLALEWRRAFRGQTSVALLMLDVDYFKAFNDCYGHQTGDEVLQTVAACVSRNIRRPGDLAARYGGEEFIVMLPETELSGARTVAEEIRIGVAKLELPHVGSPRGHITVSSGVAATRPTIGENEASLVKQADEALYQAKRSGRDQVVCRFENAFGDA